MKIATIFCLLFYVYCYEFENVEARKLTSDEFLDATRTLKLHNYQAENKNRTCTTNAECQNTGSCILQDDKKTGLCRCRFGTTGDRCQVVKDCVETPWMCDGARCVFDVEIEAAVCLCEVPGQMYDAVSKTCRDCDCGDHGISCRFFGDEKVCTCEPGFTQGPTGLCRLQCNTEMPCRNGGACVVGKCKCKPGTEGTFCEDNIKCKDDLCNKGQSMCAYDSEVGPFCKCPKIGQLYNEKKKDCVECVCGQHSYGCSFNLDNFEKVCDCKNGYADSKGICQPCDCGAHGKECKFDENEQRVCSCMQDYSSVGGLCKECSCGNSGICKFEEGIKTCSCSEGYMDIGGVCERCDCEENSEGCTFDSLGANKCTCKKGFMPAEGTCIDIDECLDSTICPKFSTCNNTEGSYICQCKDGFQPSDGKDPGSGCIDIDECNTKSTLSESSSFGCVGKSSTKCINIPGSYLCVCDVDSSPYLDNNDMAKDPGLNGCEAKPMNYWKMFGGIFIVCIVGVVTGSCVFFFHSKSPGRHIVSDLFALNHM